MNERIKELAEQARQYYLTLPTGYGPEKIGMYPQLMEKFAELIVQECCNVLQTHDIRMDLLYGAYGYDQGSLHKKIKQHFGVK